MNTRRSFIQASLGGAALVSLSSRVPGFLLTASAQEASETDRTLVVVQLSGGNDGLNTVVPYGDDQYYKNRFTLAINAGQVSKIDDHVGFHPSLQGFAKLLDDSRLSVIQGVGYPNPNRSHFESMDLWHTAHRFSESSQLGWLGRCIGDPALDDNLPAIHFGSDRQPLALGTRARPVPSITSLEQFRLRASDDPALAKGIQRAIQASRDSDNPLLGFVHDSASVALQTSARLESIVDRQEASDRYPTTNLGRKLKAVSRMIDSGLPTQIYYVTHDGFDTHSNQLQAHAGLLTELGEAIRVFVDDLAEQGKSDRVAVLMFSEFGRRVRENASRGTDHGTAAPVFVAGGGVNAGLIGQHPSLDDLEQGDLKFLIDYRQVYATVLESWLGINSTAILGDRFEQIKLFM